MTSDQPFKVWDETKLLAKITPSVKEADIRAIYGAQTSAMLQSQPVIGCSPANDVPAIKHETPSVRN